MTQETLKQAISLSRAGKKLEARELLEEILKIDPQQEAAWLWFADTYQSAGRRLQVLDTALHVNPGSQMVAQARDALLVASGFQSPKPQETPRSETQPPVEKKPPQEPPVVQDITNLYLAFDSEKRVWRVTTTPQAVEEKPAAPPAELAKTEEELLNELMALQLEEMKQKPSVEQLQSDQEELDKLIAQQLEAQRSEAPAEPIEADQEELQKLAALQIELEKSASSADKIQSDQAELDKLIAQQLEAQAAPAEQSVVEEPDEAEFDPDTIVAESFMELLQAELETGEKEAPPDWMDTEARRIEQLMSLADSETNVSENEPPAEPAEALQWVPESETAEPVEAVEPPAMTEPVESTEAAEPDEPAQPVEDTQEIKPRDSSGEAE